MHGNARMCNSDASPCVLRESSWKLCAGCPLMVYFQAVGEDLLTACHCEVTAYGCVEILQRNSTSHLQTAALDQCTALH